MPFTSNVADVDRCWRNSGNVALPTMFRRFEQRESLLDSTENRSLHAPMHTTGRQTVSRLLDDVPRCQLNAGATCVRQQHSVVQTLAQQRNGIDTTSIRDRFVISHIPKQGLFSNGNPFLRRLHNVDLVLGKHYIIDLLFKNSADLSLDFFI